MSFENPSNQDLNQDPNQELILSSVEKVDELRNIYRAKMRDALRMQKATEIMHKIVTWTNSIKEKYPDFQDYELYHVAFGSTPDHCTKMDFPGDDSAEKFIRETL